MMSINRPSDNGLFRLILCWVLSYICPVKKLILLAILLMAFSLPEIQAQSTEKEYKRKNSFFSTWGYNKSHYHDSDIRFVGEDFDFTMENVSAHDIPTPFEANTYLNPLRFTIPQFDFRIGYFIKENTSISLGWDHMKYVMTHYQQVRMTGTISPSFSEPYAGDYNNSRFDLKPSFIQMEHTNGLNYVRAAIEHHANLWDNKRDNLHVDMVFGVAAGPVMTWTDTYVGGKHYKNWLHVAGWGVSALMAPRLRFKNTFFLQYQHQFGYMDLRDIIFMDSSPNRAKQKIKFNEQSISIGAQIPIFIGGNPNKGE